MKVNSEILIHKLNEYFDDLTEQNDRDPINPSMKDLNDIELNMNKLECTKLFEELEDEKFELIKK